MKVTVNFGAVRVIVPCGTGDLPVKELMELAVTRYKKAISKDSDIVIHNLKISSDGGILDPDDKLNDVADDREQIIATFDESLLPYYIHNGGDGTSASSVGTESPDIFQQNGDIGMKPLRHSSDVEIISEKISTGILPLHVRRGSEPALNSLSPSHVSPKRWSAAIVTDGEYAKGFNSDDEAESDSEPGEREDGSGEEKLSLTHDERREPLGGPMTAPMICNDENSDSTNCDKNCEIVKLKNEDGPLGIHVVPASDGFGNEFGLVIQGIEPGGRIDRDGRFNVGDRITEINGLSLKNECFQDTQEIFKDALKAPEISIRCVKSESSDDLDGPNVQSAIVLPTQKTVSDSSDDMTEDEKNCAMPKPKFFTPTTKPLVFAKSPSSVHSSLRKVGRRILIHLKKGSGGLGFSISTKELNNTSHLFIKNILPVGAAVDDGRLRVGDKILEVNRIDVSGKSQSEVVSMLRKVTFGESVELVVCRHETDNSPSPHLPRQLPPEKAGDTTTVFPSNKKEVFTFNIPLNDTGSAGLGVSVKGKTSATDNRSVDMGIFVKSVIHGGAASKDGRLRSNDQLLNINGISLLTMTNSQAMETLRRAMIQGEGPSASPNAITLTVSRRLPPFPDSSEYVDSSSHERSDSLLSESGDSFYVSNENLLAPIVKHKGVTPDTSVSDNSATTVIHVSKSSDLDEYDDHMNIKDRQDFPSPYLGDNPIIEQLTGWKNFTGPNFRGQPQKFSNYITREGTGNQPLTLLDTDPEDSLYSPISVQNGTEKEQKAMQRKNMLIHQKSFSTSAEINYQFPTPMKSKKKEFRRDRHNEDSPVFYRNGYSRQSMPEKDLYQKTSRNANSPRAKPIDYKDCHLNSQRSMESFAEKRKFFEFASKRIPREMPVDVGACTTYAKRYVNKSEQVRVTNQQVETSSQAWSNSADSGVSSIRHGILCSEQGSCHSPGCPYHAVPTTERENNESHGNSLQLGPTLGMYKSSSLESLQTMVTETQKREIVYNKDGTRQCNESFRAAVDRSYEVPSTETLEVLQEICENGVSLIARPTVTRPRIRSATVGPTSDAMPNNNGKTNGKSTKKKGIFRGLGSVFKFGKSSKKSAEEISSKSEQKEKHKKKDAVQRDNEMILARNAAEDERQRIQQQYQKLIEAQKVMQQQQDRQSQLEYSINSELPNSHSSPFPGYSVTQSPSRGISPQNRQQRMHQLRAEHQRRHQQRQGSYPGEEKEEIYEQNMKDAVDKQEMWRRPLPPLPHQIQEFAGYESPHVKTNFDLYKEMSKPGSRKGFADPDRYSHYMNFQEIQQQLKRFQTQENYLKNSKISEIMLQLQHEASFPNEQHTLNMRMPKQYRHTLNSSRVRPVSDAYNYNSAQNGNIPTKLKSGAKSLPRQSFTAGRRMPIPAYMIAGNMNANSRSQSPYSIDRDPRNERNTSSKV